MDMRVELLEVESHHSANTRMRLVHDVCWMVAWFLGLQWKKVTSDLMMNYEWEYLGLRGAKNVWKN